MGRLLRQFLEQSEQLTLMVTGGDTLLAFMRCLNVAELTPYWEAAPGIVLSGFIYRGNTYNLLSKSGGFGKINAISELGNQIWKP